MNLPLYKTGVLDYSTGMALATVLGFFFGFALERGGFSRATILASQFYGRNNRVFKVMFTAIATATVGLGVMDGFGWIDVALLDVPRTNIMPLAAGGFLLGVGFVMSGYCPGTAVVGIASGSKDAAYSLFGIALGSVIFALGWDVIEEFYVGNDLGIVRLTDTFGLSWSIVAFGVLLVAVAGFLGAEAVERFFAKKDGTEVPDADPGPRNTILGTVGVFGLVGIASLAMPAPEACTQKRQLAEMNAVEVAEGVMVNPKDYWVVDLRASEICAKKRIPGALCVPEDDTAASFIGELPTNRTLVLYGAGDTIDLPESALKYGGVAVTMTGGWAMFEREMLTAPKVPENPTPDAVAAFRLRAAMHGHFSGVKTKAPTLTARPKAVKRAARKGGGC